MKTLSKFILFSLIILLTISTISASEDLQNTENSIDNNINDNNVLEENNIVYNNIIENKNIVKKEEVNSKNKQATTITITNKTYNQFFEQNTDDEFVTSTDLIKEGDTVNLKGTFNNVKFAVDKKITFTSLNKDAYLYNSTVYVLGQNASGSVISNLKIDNNGTLLKGIQVKDSSNLTIKDNNIKTLGLRAYGFVADNMYNSTIQSNVFEREGDDWRYITFIIGKSHYNIIDNNTINCGGANGIYLSIYGSVEANFDGGPSNYNNITRNKIKATGYITSWCYTIQVMGENNLVAYNTVEGGFRGISSQDYENNTIIYNDVHAINEGIYACEKAIVSNNTIHVNETSKGITVGGDNALIVNNTINSIDGPGIEIQANNVKIINNTITSTNGYGIYAKGQYVNILVDNNKITSKKEGIMFKQQSRSKKINHIRLTNNNIVSESDYAVDFQEAGSQNPDEINITVSSSNVLVSNKGIGISVAYLKPANAVNNTGTDEFQELTITPGNYNEYFENGIANTLIKQNATIYLHGTFNNNNFTFNKKVHIIGINCQINNGTLTLSGDAHESTIQDISIKNNKEEVTVHGIELLEVNNCEITNVTIDNYGELESLGIFVYSANGNYMHNSKITTHGDYINDAILVYASDANRLENNNIYLNQSGIPHEYDESIMFNEKIGLIKEVLHNHGIILIYSSENIINNNKINATSNFNAYTYPSNDCQNSIVGIDIYFDSHNNKVTNNSINIKSFTPFVYGMGVLGGQWGTSITSTNATGNIYKNNMVYLEGGYFATGFIAGRNSVKTEVNSNNITIHVYHNNTARGDYAHGITLENSTNSTIVNNKLVTTGSSLYNIELFDSNNNQIINNTIVGNATYPYAISGYRTSNNMIMNNDILLKKVDYGQVNSANHADNIPAGDDAIMLMSESRNNQIILNSINTNGSSTVKLTSETRNNNVTENSLISKTSFGDNSVVNQHTSNKIYNNFVYFVNVTTNSANAKLGDTIKLNATIKSTTTDLKNLTVTFKLGTETIGTSKVSNSKASINYNVSTLLNPTTYTLTVDVSGTNFQNSSTTAYLTFEKDPDRTTVDVGKVLSVVNKNVNLTANITTLDGGKIGSGNVEFYVDDVLIGTSNVRLGVSSMVYNVGNVPSVHDIRVVYLGTMDYAPSEGSNILGVQSSSSITLVNHTASLGGKVTINATVKTGGQPVSTGDAIIKINNSQVTTAKIKNGKLSYVYTVPNSMNKGSCNLQVIYLGNDTAATVNKTAKITFAAFNPVFSYNTTSVKVNDSASLVLNINNGLTGNTYQVAQNGNVSIKLDGKILKDASGKTVQGNIVNGTITFKFTVPNDLKGSHNITFIYSGNSKFNNGTQTFTNALIVRKDTILTINNIGNHKYNDIFNITGKFENEDGVALKNSNVKLKINGVTYTVKTDTNGIYTYEYKSTLVGVNNITVSYPGNTKYNGANVSTTFTVSKKNTKITMNSLNTAKYNDKVTVTGKFTNEDGNALINSNIKLTLNGNAYTVKTDTNGIYTYIFNANIIGKNNVTVSYAGNAKYNGYNLTKSFTVNKKDTQLTMNSLKTVKYNDKVTVTGKFTNEDGNALKNSNIKITINGIEHTVKTDSNGIYNYTFNANIIGKNNVTVSYAGNAKYNGYNLTKSFTVNKKDTQLTINNIPQTTKGKTVTVTGKFTNEDGNALQNSNVKLTINNQEFTIKTDTKGIYTYNYTTTTKGTNNVTVSYPGNAKYNSCETTTTFKVV